MNSKIQHFQCAYTSETMEVEKYGEETYLCIKTGQNLSFLSKLRHVWRILTEGIPFEHRIVLDSLGRLTLSHILSDNDDRN